MPIKIFQGRIVFPLDPVPDPQGQNPKANRPFVVVSRPQDIATGGPLHLVGISSTSLGGADEVELPWGPNCQTRLSKRSVAICSWQIHVAQDRVEVSRGLVPPTELREILRRLSELNGRS